MVAEFVVSGPQSETLYFRNIRYLAQSLSASTNPSSEAIPTGQPSDAHPTVGSPLTSTVPSWEKAGHDLQSAHGSERIVEIRQVDGP